MARERNPEDGAVSPAPQAAAWEATIVAFLQHHVEGAHAKGVVVGVSGGLDSAVVAALAVRSLGTESVLAIMLPSPDSHPEDAEHARLVCDSIGLKPLLHGIGPIVAGLDKTLGGHPDARIAGNAKARARMMILYAEAQKRDFLVCGTGNKSELLTGYFTKWGDGGVDLQPIGDLYKTQVRELARHLGIPAPIIAKPPSAGLYPGQTDEGDMGLSYEELDSVLKGMELNLAPDAIARKSGLKHDLVAKVEAMVRKTEHKRHLPLIPKLGARTVGVDWRRSVQWQ
ncbi:MAG: NAD+ synthase [Thermoplasmatota archaeon]